MIRQKKIALAIVVFYFVFLPVGAYLSYLFLKNTKLVYRAPEGSLVYNSENTASAHFEDQIGGEPLWMLVTNINATQSIVENNDFKRYCTALNASIHAGGSMFGSVTFLEGYFFVPDVPQLRNQLIGGANNRSTLLNMNVASKQDYKSFETIILDFNNDWLAANNATDSFKIQYTGVQMISEDLESGILGDLAIIDAISMPLAFAALAYCLSSFRLLLVPLMTVPCTITLAFTIMLPVSHVTDVSSFAPEMAAACMMAISIDYALFILSRFVEQVEMQEARLGKSEATEWIVIRNTAVLSAHNILISGLTIAVALGGLAFLPINFLSTIGMTMSCGAVCAVCVSMTLMPCLLFVGYHFYSTSSECGALVKKYREWRGDKLLNNEVDNLLGVSGSRPDDIGEYRLLQYRDQMSSIWFKIGRLAFQRPLLTCLAVCAAGVPFFYYAFQLRVDFDLFNQVPRNSIHAKVLKDIVAEIGRGTAAPFYLTFIANNDSNTVWNSPEFFEIVNNVTMTLSDRTGQPLDRILSPSMIPAGLIGNAEPMWLTNTLSQAAYDVNLGNYSFLFHRTVSNHKTAALLSIFTVFDPFSYEANDFLNKVNDIITEFSGQQLLTLGVLGASADSWAIMRDAMRLFPYQIGITFGVIFVFIAAVFRSAFVPFRMVFTVAYTIGMSYGAGVIMFEYSWLHHVWNALQGVNAYVWTVPIFSFSLLSALALDYDVFLLTRILEFKKMGYCDEAAISKAVWKTGRIISFAGVIMFIAFGSLVFSNTTMLNQFGAIAAFAVAVDTFVIRSFFAPALMAVFPSWAWWPRKFPELDRSVDDMRGDLAEEGSNTRTHMYSGGDAF